MRAAVLVTFNPDERKLRMACSALAAQVDCLCVVDNASENNVESMVAATCDRFIQLATNLGIAAAQNLGIRAVLTEGADYIVLSDQDSLMPQGAVDEFVDIIRSEPSCAAAVPMFFDDKLSAPSGFIMANSIFFQPLFVGSGRHDLLQAISSGMTLEAKSLSTIGLMNEELFIDWVDIEWCWRARSKGFRIIGTADVKMSHCLGDTAKNLGFRRATLRSPQRHYYITRNAIYSARHDRSLSRTRRVILGCRSLRYIIAFPLLAKPRLSNLKAVVLGTLHGLTGRLGRFDLQE